MIYIIDNDEPYGDNQIYFVEASERECRIFGEAIEPILLSRAHGYGSTPFIMGIANDIQWRGEYEHENFLEYIHFHNIARLTEGYQGLKRVATIPPLGDEAIECLIDGQIQNSPKHKERYLEFIEWDDVRTALRAKGTE